MHNQANQPLTGLYQSSSVFLDFPADTNWSWWYDLDLHKHGFCNFCLLFQHKIINIAPNLSNTTDKINKELELYVLQLLIKPITVWLKCGHSFWI